MRIAHYKPTTRKQIMFMIDLFCVLKKLSYIIYWLNKQFIFLMKLSV